MENWRRAVISSGMIVGGILILRTPVRVLVVLDFVQSHGRAAALFSPRGSRCAHRGWPTSDMARTRNGFGVPTVNPAVARPHNLAAIACAVQLFAWSQLGWGARDALMLLGGGRQLTVSL